MLLINFFFLSNFQCQPKMRKIPVESEKFNKFNALHAEHHHALKALAHTSNGCENMQPWDRWFIRTLNFSHKLILLWFPSVICIYRYYVHIYSNESGRRCAGGVCATSKLIFPLNGMCAIYQIDTRLGECGWHLQRRQLLVSINRCCI